MTTDPASEVAEVLAACGAGIDSHLAANTLRDTGWFCIDQTAETLLLIGVPQLSLSAQQHWLGGIRMGVWPRIALNRRRVSIVSSRLTRNLHQHTDWFDAFRTFVCRLDAANDVLLTCSGTTADRFIRRAARLFGLDCFPIVVGTDSPQQQIQQYQSQYPVAQIELSAPLLGSDEWQLPFPDRSITALAQHVRALSVKPGSQTHRLLKARLADETFPTASVHVTSTSAAADDLANSGAALWVLMSSPDHEDEGTVVPHAALDTILTEPPFDDYLLHWTRQPDGLWPDEDVDDYLDKLILSVEAADRTAFATLVRIVQNRKLLATSHLIRGGHKMVCLTETPLNEFAAKRTYRRHLRRWDYEPYGVGIRKTRMQELGTRPVLYRDEADFENISPDDQPYFQLRATADSRTEWIDEAEWRLAGDLDLGTIDAADVFVFVPSRSEAQVIARQCEWPVVVLARGTD